MLRLQERTPYRNDVRQVRATTRRVATSRCVTVTTVGGGIAKNRSLLSPVSNRVHFMGMLMTSETGPEFDIAIIGCGMHNAHLTLESLEILKSCKRGFVSTPTQEEAGIFRESVLKHLKATDSLPPLVNLSVAYREDRSPTDNYADAGEVVLEAARFDARLPTSHPGIL